MSPGDRWPGRVAALLLAFWYTATMAGDLAWFDAGELALVGHELGLGHPPGQPLYTLLLAVFARLPGLDPLTGMNLLSALSAAACALPADALARRLTSASATVRLWALLSVGALTPLWDQGTRIELYATATLLALTLIAAGVAVVQAERRDARAWLGLGVLSGLAACVNPVFGLTAALAVGTYALPMLGTSTPRAVLAAAVGAAAGLAPYAYLWWVHDATDRMVWGELGDWAGVRAYLTGADYTHTRTHVAEGGWTAAPGHIAKWLGWLVLEGGAVVLVLAALGWLGSGLRRHVVLAAVPVFIGSMYVFTAGDTFFPEMPDYNGYLAPSLWLGACGVAASLDRLPRASAWAVGLLVLTLGTGERPLWDRNRSALVTPRMMAETWLESAPTGALLLVESDHLVFPLMYLQEVERTRPDVAVFNVGFGASSWYWRHVYRRHPDLPPIELRAPDTPTRLRRLLRAGVRRPVAVESGRLAAAMGLRPCPRTWGFAIGPACAHARDDPEAFETALRSWSAADPITPKVLAATGFSRAETLWALADVGGTLHALRAGIPGGANLPVPTGLARPVDAPPLRHPGPVLIGDPLHNRLLGAELLERLGRPKEAATWRDLSPRAHRRLGPAPGRRARANWSDNQTKWYVYQTNSREARTPRQR